MNKIGNKLALILALAFTASPVVSQSFVAMSYSPSERVKSFSICAGRFSALAEHQMLFSGADYEATMEIAQSFDQLLEATMDHAIEYGMPKEQAISWRVSAKTALHGLLSDSTFQLDNGRRDRAELALKRYLAECDGLILGA